jgi:uncharacterized protein YbbC (DUF1343 family)
MINREGWLDKGVHADLTVVPMEGWTRAMSWTETGLDWYPPSPNIPKPVSAMIYPATCYLEGTNLSEGRGTSMPFSQFGAPFLNATAFAQSLDSLGLSGVRFGTTTFMPSSSKFAGKLCQGVSIEITDPRSYSPVSVGLHIVNLLARRIPRECQFNRKRLSQLFGDGEVLNVVDGKKNPDAVLERWKQGERGYIEKASRYWKY